jgi:hypothetical protein
MKPILLSCILIILLGCNSREYRNSCFLASSPIDLTIINPVKEVVELEFYIYDSNQFRRIEELRIKPNGTITKCFENEGPIINGLYVYDGIRAYKIKLGIDTYTLNLDNKDIQIQVPKELKEMEKE